VAVTSLREAAEVAAEDIITFAADHLAGYKLPRQILIADAVRRAPNGKADYKWAKAYAEKKQ
jgi:acyl-CoA synthetase (AMP-forming)/AMP-acid ligase II